MHKCNHKFTKFNFYEIQETVKSTIENLSGIEVDSVNIHIQGIDYSEDHDIDSESESDTE